MNEQALPGVQVLACTQEIAGSYCTKLLADFGAEANVIGGTFAFCPRKADPHRPYEKARVMLC
jgi:hypothetical protein